VEGKIFIEARREMMQTAQIAHLMPRGNGVAMAKT